MNDRIRLAEAMQIGPACSGQREQWEHWVAAKFDPFTSADDDYAVLEWMRGKCGVEPDFAWAEDQATWNDFSLELDDAVSYQIGDYARAALKVIE